MLQRLKWVFFCVLALSIASCATRKNNSKTHAERAADALSEVRSKKLVRFIREWEGVPYQLGGISKRGIDCSGFTLLLERDIYGATLPRRSIEQARAIRRKSLANMREGDLIFFSFGGKEVDHVGIYLNRNYFVHASTQRGVMIDDLAFYQRQIVSMGAIR